MQRVTRNSLAIGIGLLVSVLAINAGIAYLNTWQLHDNAQWVAHTHEVLDSLESLQSTIKDAETGQRGYLITGREEYLSPYENALTRHDQALDRVATLTTDNREQQADILQLRKLIATKLDELKTTIALRKEQGFDAAQQAVNTDDGRRTMTAIRSLVATMQARERTLLAQREEADRAAYRRAVVAIAVSALAGLIAIVAFVWLLRRHLKSVVDSAADLYEQRELLRATLISIGDGVIATDAEGRITFLNGVAQSLTGWTEPDATGRPLDVVFKIVNEETRQVVPNPALRALAEGRIVGLANHTILIAKDGVEWPIDDSAAPIKSKAGRVRGAILVFHEIKERKAREDELRRQAESLADADRRKDEFLAMLAHELRNPLAPLSNALQLWPFVENDQAELEALRGVMERQLTQMIRLIDDLLDVSRITRGKIQLRKQQVDIHTIISGAVEAVKPFLDACAHRLTLALPTEPLLVEGDVARLTQVFANILSNAAKYTGRNGVIWVSAEKPNGSVVVKIRDNGPGIPEHMLGEIFELFHQVDGTLNRSHGGLGIGLTLVKRLVEEHGGTVEARSEGPGKGSEFIVTLAESASQVPHRGSTERHYRLHQVPDMPGHRILVVDDVDASAQTLAMMLRAIGQQVTTLSNGAAAIEWTLANNPDVLFLDIAMPGMNGYEVAQRLRKERPTLVLIALTGYGQEDDRRRAFEAGFNHHLVKPASMEALERVLLTIPKAHTEVDSGAS